VSHLVIPQKTLKMDRRNSLIFCGVSNIKRVSKCKQVLYYVFAYSPPSCTAPKTTCNDNHDNKNSNVIIILMGRIVEDPCDDVYNCRALENAHAKISTRIKRTIRMRIIL